jgi:uncharacterized protein (DUF1501 family)
MTGLSLDRRSFLKGAALAATTPLWVRLGAEAASSGQVSGGQPTPSKLLLLVWLQGGNDGLNTVVPYLDPAYRRLRPHVALSPSSVLDIGSGLGLNGALPWLHSAWGRGQVAIVHNVGYARPNYSHFESASIWQTASTDGRYQSGWVGRYLDATAAQYPAALRAVAAQSELPRLLASDQQHAAAVNSLDNFDFSDQSPSVHAVHHALRSFSAGASGTDMRAKVTHAQGHLLDAVSAVRAVAQQAPAALSPSQMIGRIMGSGLGTQIGFLSVDGFDTHSLQLLRHATLLTKLDTALKEFFATASAMGLGDRATAVVLTEFGRRAGDNGSGTDHGSSTPVFVVGPRVRGGHVGTRPDLTRLDQGNLIPAIDYRSVYASILEQVLGLDADPVLGGSFPRLPLVS